MTKASVFNKKQYSNEQTDQILAESGSKFTGKVFLYMFIALAITAITTLAFASILRSIFTTGSEEVLNSLSGVVIFFVLAYIPLIIWIQVSILRGGKGLAPAFVIYSIYLGALLSPIISAFELIDATGSILTSGISLMGLVGIAFGLTCAAFAVMALIAWNTKKNLSNLAVVGYGLLSGALIILFASFIFGLIFGINTGLSSALFSGVFFIFVILITIVDLYNIRSIAARGAGSNNLAMVCAFSLYTDFVYIFVRLLWFVLNIAVRLNSRR